MSERYLFNKKLHNRSRRWLWVGGSVAALVIFNVLAAPAIAQEQETVLLDPYAEVDKIFNSTLTNIDFSREADNMAVTVIEFDNDNFSPQLIEAQGKLTITLPKTELGDDQLVELDVVQFGTEVQSIETFQDEESASLVINYKGTVLARHRKQGNTLRIELQPMSKEELAELDKDPEYSGKPISLDFQDVPVRQVLQIIAQTNGFNLVTTDTVTGNVTIRLEGVPWDQALAMILKIKGLDKRMEGNILLVAPAEELTARETAQLQSKKQVSDLAPLTTSNITVNYAKADAIAQILKSQDGGILSDRGSVTVDERTNTLLLKDTQESIDEARAVINALDIPVKQVLIESRMVTVRDNVDEELGVRWGITDTQSNGAISGSLEGADSASSGSVPDISDRLNVNLPVTTTGVARIGFQIADLIDGNILDLELSALESENKGEIIASPRITVANQHEAYIEQGTEIPYVQATSSGATSVEFKKAVLSLKVTPHITPDNRIILDLVVTQDTRGETVDTSTGPAVAIDTQEIQTQVLVDNGETVVLGGIFQQTSTSDVSKVPLFGDLPVVGNLFKRNASVYQKRELLIFVTPKIVAESL
ncbi:type IV pilus secretin PilQ family protein [Alteromonas sp. 1_MG-2023]|uniref:type IV pilus secretin PilQ n=1 Tax=Alteromonas sp. 1_MG-2023 TaxID=3062669 RepID=UPI0026E23AC7|nr:type IV pilus secretin PilQ family protein [Alteromonas sp. 1_MG-2023]MDO6473810.1 type IV pilus secretin PilQ family protein [Alteromonas sp. 1_MG-2023]